MAYVQIPLETFIFLLCLLVFGVGYFLGTAIERAAWKHGFREQKQKK
jgi:hypothetical protein